MATNYFKCDATTTSHLYSYIIYKDSACTQIDQTIGAGSSQQTYANAVRYVKLAGFSPASGYGAPYHIVARKESFSGEIDNQWYIPDDNDYTLNLKSYNRYFTITASKINWENYTGTLYDKTISTSIKCNISQVDHVQLQAYNSGWWSKGNVSIQQGGTASFNVTLDQVYDSIKIRFVAFDSHNVQLEPISNEYTLQQSASFYSVTNTAGSYIASVTPTGTTTGVAERTGLAINAITEDSYWGNETDYGTYWRKNYLSHSFASWTITSGRGTFGSPTTHNTTFYPQANSTIRAGGTQYVSEYRIWYRITYNAGGGSGTMDPQDSSYVASAGTSTTVTTKPNEFTRAGYSFNGWTRSDSTTKVPDGGSVTITKNITLTATWVESTRYYYRMKFDYNGGLVPPSSDTATYDPSSSTYYTSYNQTYTFNITSKTPTKSGNNFLGWSADGTSSGTVYHYGDTITVGAIYPAPTVNVSTLYAVFEPIQYDYHLIEHFNGGTWQSKYSHDFGTTTTTATTKSYTLLPATKTGCKLLGYSRDSTAKAAEFPYSSGSTVILPTNTGWREGIIYAVWFNNASFSWTSNDSTNIAIGKPVSNITAAKWNEFTNRINEVRQAKGWTTYNFTQATQGAPITAAMFNEAVLVLSYFHETVPAQVNTGDSIKASYFNGTGSIKAALNNAISSI